MRAQLKGRFAAILALSMLVVTLSACTTSSYGKGLQAIPGTDNEYLLKIYVGGFSGPDTATKAAEKEIGKFMAETDFESYEIVDRHFSFIPSYYEYRIRFSERPVHDQEDGKNQ